jgi:hypothetical protein
MAYVLVNSLRRLASQTTDLADATCGAILSGFKVHADEPVDVGYIAIGR